jgi:hypothetical protein
MKQEFPPVLAAWLRRARNHHLRDRFLLSGSTLIAALCPNGRIPKDIDYAVRGHYDASLMKRAIMQIVGTPDPHSQLQLQNVAEIFDYSDGFPGIRAELIELLPAYQLQEFQVDFAFGDPLTLEPRLIEIADIGAVLAVAPESLFAWKVHALVQFGPHAWRPKDIYDLHVLWEEGQLQIEDLPEAIDIAFSSRDSSLEELDAFRFDVDWGLLDNGIRQWNTFARTYNIQRSFWSFRSQIRTILNSLL